MQLPQSGLYVYDLYPVNRYDRGRQYELQVDVESVSDVAPFVEAIASRLEALKVGTEFRPAWLFSSAESRSRRDCFDDNR